ncbi:MAG: glutathione S-transferase family protein [Proteobacteria bacterium]|nr:glutathione S-transferase family protein [Pseudomonadota bacterium]
MHLFTQSGSPNGRRVNVFIKEKGIEIPTTEIDLRAGENLSAEFRARNPFGRVPTLTLNDGRFLSESQAICHYLEYLHPAPNLFGDTAEEKAMIEMWSLRVDLNLLKPVAQGFRHSTGFYKDREKCVAEWGQVAAEVARDAAVLFDELLAGKEYLLGDRYSVADMTLAIVMNFAKQVGQDFFDLTNLARFHANVTARPAFS